MCDITTLNFLSYSLWKHDIYRGKGSEGGGNPSILFIIFISGIFAFIF